MQDMTTFDWTDAPMSLDRTAGWAWVRSFGDVFRGSDGNWFLAGTEAVQFAYRNPEIFSSAQAFEMLGSPVPLVPLAIDPPDHRRFRKVLDPLFAPRVVNRIEDSLRDQVRQLIATFAERGHCDAVDDLARLYPTQVFLTLFGLPLADRDRLIHWSESIIEATPGVGTPEPSPEAAQNAAELFAYLQAAVDEKRSNPGDDVLSHVVQLEGDDEFSDAEVLGLCFLFVLAGLDTVTSMIGFTLLALARDEALRTRVTEDPALVSPLIEEVLRLEPAAPSSPRITTREVEVAGTIIPEGALCMIAPAAINRDPARFPHPDTIDLEHADLGHNAFGGGIHRCLGSHLARRELKLVVEEFLAAIPDFALAPDAVPQLVWPSGTFHLRDLPLVFPSG